MAKPSVDGLEEELGDRLAFTRVDIMDDEGSKVATKYGVRSVPTFLLVSAQGEVLYKKVGGMPERELILQAFAEATRSPTKVD